MIENIKNRFKINITKRQQSTKNINIQSIIPESVNSVEIDTDYSSTSSATQEYQTSDVDIDNSSNSSFDNDKSQTKVLIYNNNVNQSRQNVNDNSLKSINYDTAVSNLTQKYSLSIFNRNDSIQMINSLPTIDTKLINNINTIDSLIIEIVNGYKSSDNSEYNNANNLFEFIKPAAYMKAPSDQILVVGRKFAPLADKLEQIINLNFGELLMQINKQIDSNLYNLLNIIYDVDKAKLLEICFKECHKPKHHIEAYSPFDGLIVSCNSIIIPEWIITIANEYIDNLLELSLVNVLTITNEMIIVGFRKILFDSGLLLSKVPQMSSTPTMLSLYSLNESSTIQTKRFSITRIDKSKHKTDVVNDIINEIIPDNEIIDLTVNVNNK